MKTKTIQQTVRFTASPRAVYELLMDSRKHTALSGETARISRRVGGPFTAWGSHITGINLVLKPGRRIAWATRAAGSDVERGPLVDALDLGAMSRKAVTCRANRRAAHQPGTSRTPLRCLVNGLVTPCKRLVKRAGAGGPGSQATKRSQGLATTRCGWPATTPRKFTAERAGRCCQWTPLREKGCILQGDGCDVAAVSGRLKF